MSSDVAAAGLQGLHLESGNPGDVSAHDWVRIYTYALILDPGVALCGNWDA